jgi:hypothetical protein
MYAGNYMHTILRVHMNKVSLVMSTCNYMWDFLSHNDLHINMYG